MNRRKFLLMSAAGVAAAPLISTLAWSPATAFAAETRVADTVRFGAYANGAPYPCTNHYNLEATVGPIKQMSWFVNWSVGFPRAAAETKPAGYELLVAWMPILNGGAAVPFSQILAGQWDSYITKFLTDAGNYGHRVAIRFAHEMNLGTMVWSVGRGGPSSTDEFIAVWRYIYGIKQRLNLANVTWHFSIANADKDPANPAERYWPGSAYVDAVGADLYAGWDGRPLITANKLITPSYNRLNALGPTLPYWIHELGCRQTTATEAYSKSQWHTDLFTLPTSTFPNLKNIVFFSKSREQDWRLDSSPEVTATVRSLLATRAII